MESTQAKTIGKLNLNIDEDGVKKITRGMFRKANEGDIMAMFDIISVFVVDDNGLPIEGDELDKIMDEVSIGQAEQIFLSLSDRMQEAAAPKK